MIQQDKINYESYILFFFLKESIFQSIVITNMLKLVNNLLLSRSGSSSLRVQVSLFVSCFNDSVTKITAIWCKGLHNSFMVFQTRFNSWYRYYLDGCCLQYQDCSHQGFLPAASTHKAHCAVETSHISSFTPATIIKNMPRPR